MRVIVAGCAGFIGWKVSELLIRAGHEVLGVDDLNPAYDVRLKFWRLAQLQGLPRFEFDQSDITDRSKVAEFRHDLPLDAVVNLAARAGVRQSLHDPWGYYETNVLGTLNLLELCRERGVRKFVLASTSSVYGEREGVFREDQPTDRPLSPYASSKKAAETLCYTYHQLYGLDISVLRYFTVYGPAGRPDMSYFRFIRWMAEGEPVAVYGDGTQQRSFTHVDDVAAATVLALGPVGYEIINLGTNRPVTVSAMIRTLEGLVGRPAIVEHCPRHPADVSFTAADISKAQALFQWAPKTSFEQGLATAVDWYLDQRSWARELVLPA